MICPKCDQEFEGQCECGYQPKALQARQQWLIQYCTTPGCEVAIRVKIEAPVSHPVCQWCANGTAYNTRPRPQINPPVETLMSLDEFGQDLFDAIRMQSAMQQAFRTAQLYRDKGMARAAEDSERAIVTLQQQLEALLNKQTIAPADLQRLLTIT